MMKRWVGNLVGLLAVLVVCTTARAELKLVANFDGMTGTPDGQACNGVLGATIDTESEGTGNVSFQTVNGSGTLSPIGHSSGTLSRAAGVAGINNPITNDETGIAFFRFSMATGGTIRDHIGLIADTGNNPVNAARTADPKAIPAGFRLVEDSAGKKATATDPTLVTAAAWTQWKIPLSSFAGVNLSKVKKLTIGVGNRASPVQDGTGKLYFDDLGFGHPAQ